MASPTYDFIIVGAGPAGCSLASGLAKSAARPSVLLLEAGGEASDPGLGITADRFTFWASPSGAAIDYGYKSTKQSLLNGRELAYARGKGLGGSSLNNITGWDYGAKQDLNEWARLVGDDAWSWEKSLEKFRKIETYHDDTPKEFEKYHHFAPGMHGTQGPLDITVPSEWEPGLQVILEAAREYGFPLTADLNNDQGIGVGVVAHTCYDGRRTTAASAYLSDKPVNLTVLVESSVIRVLFEGKRAVGVEVSTGVKYLARKDVVLSAGSIDTPKILLLSGIGPAQELNEHQIPVVSDVAGIGKGLRDHTIVRTQRLIKPGALKGPIPYGREEELERWLKDRSGPLGILKGYFAIGYLKLDSDIAMWPEFQSIPENEKNLMSRPDVPDFEVSIRLEPYKPDGTLVINCNTVGMHTQSRGSVSLRSADPRDLPVIDLQYLAHPYDQRAMVESLRTTFNFIHHSSIPTDELVLGPKSLTEKDLLEYIKDGIGPVWHALGTVKMGKVGEEETCVDSDFRVLGVENLRVADLSVCPVLPCNHTQSTAYLVGVTAAEKIIAEYHLDEESGN